MLTIFGISGDLAKKMTFRALYRLEARDQLKTPIVGVAIDDWDDERLREHAREAIAASIEDPDEDVFGRLAQRLSYIQGDYADAATFAKVGEAIAGKSRPVFYLEVPPSLFSTVVHGLADAGLTEHARVVIEKPFGHDLESARALNAELCEVLGEEQILRIDHYLGKEPVMDIAYLRFANSILEPVWNREHVSHVQMTIAEDFGVDDRGRFYDAVGAMRDVIQNHGLQVAGPGRHGPADRQPPRLDPRQEARILQSRADRGPEEIRARAVRRLPRRRGSRRRTRPPRPSRRSSCRSTTGAGAASPSSSARGRTCRSRRLR